MKLSASDFSELTVVIPFYNEEENVEEVVSETKRKLPRARILAVDDGSEDRTLQILKQIKEIKVIAFPENSGQSAAILAGLSEVETKMAATMDGDGQNDPADLVRLLEKWREHSVVCGKRINRKDTLSKKITSKIGNSIRNLILKDGISDTGCSLKLFPNHAISVIPPFNGVHRFLPAFWKNAGFEVLEVGVSHRPRLKGYSKYNNLGRARRGFWDLVGVHWFLHRKVFPKRARSV